MKRIKAGVSGFTTMYLDSMGHFAGWNVSESTDKHERQSDADSVARVHLSRNSWRNVVKDRVRLIEQKDIGATLARRVATIY